MSLLFKLFDRTEEFYQIIPSWRINVVKEYPIDWSKYSFDRSYKYLLEYGLRYRLPSFDSEWVKIILHLQIYGGCGTINDIFSYAGFNPENLRPSRKYRFINFLQYYHIIEQIKRVRNGGRIFELTRFGEDLIDYIAKRDSKITA